MGKRIIAIITVILLLLIPFSTETKEKPKSFEAKIHGGITKSKSIALWEIHKYKDTELMRKPPLCYAPWRAYLAVDRYVEVTNVDNCNALIIHKDLAEMVEEDATFNKAFAKKFSLLRRMWILSPLSMPS